MLATQDFVRSASVAKATYHVNTVAKGMLVRPKRQQVNSASVQTCKLNSQLCEQSCKISSTQLSLYISSIKTELLYTYNSYVNWYCYTVPG